MVNATFSSSAKSGMILLRKSFIFHEQWKKLNSTIDIEMTPNFPEIPSSNIERNKYIAKHTVEIITQAFKSLRGEKKVTINTLKANEY